MSNYRHRRTARELRIARLIEAKFAVKSLLGYDNDPKTSKSNAISDEYYTVIMYLSPHNIGGLNVCPHATIGCIRACLHTAGNPAYKQNKDRARLNRKRLFKAKFRLFMAQLYAELREHIARAEAIGKRLAVRLNGTSDIPWELLVPNLFSDFSDVTFYDYTKDSSRVARYLLRDFPVNYHLTFSRSENNHSKSLELLASGARVAIVFSTARTKSLPSFFDGYAVADQDTDDLTFLRSGGQWLGLRAKGRGRRDNSGFVVRM